MLRNVATALSGASYVVKKKVSLGKQDSSAIKRTIGGDSHSYVLDQSSLPYDTYFFLRFDLFPNCGSTFLASENAIASAWSLSFTIDPSPL